MSISILTALSSPHAYQSVTKPYTTLVLDSVLYQWLLCGHVL